MAAGEAPKPTELGPAVAQPDPGAPEPARAPGIPRRTILTSMAGGALVGAFGLPGSARAETPTPQDPLDVEIEKRRAALLKLQQDRPKQKILDDLNKQIEAESNPQKPASATDPKDAKIAELEKQGAAYKKEFDDFKKSIANDPNVKLFTDAQLKQYVDAAVEVRLKAIEAETARQRAAEANKRAQDEQAAKETVAAAERAKTEAQSIKDRATTEAAGVVKKAEEQAAAMKANGTIDVPFVGETDAKTALAGAAVAGGLLGRVVRPVTIGRRVFGGVRGLGGLVGRLRPTRPGGAPHHGGGTGGAAAGPAPAGRAPRPGGGTPRPH